MADATLQILLKPRSKHDRVVSVQGTSVALAVTSPPVDGRANEHMIESLARILGMPKSSFRLIVGAASRRKIVRVTGISQDDAARRLQTAVDSH